MGRFAEAATVAALGVAIILGAAQAPHKDGWPWWAISFMAIGAVIIAVAALNLMFGFLHRPALLVWNHARRVRIGFEPNEPTEDPIDGNDARATDFRQSSALQRQLISVLFQFDFTGLFAKTEQYIEAIVYVSQTLGSPVTLTGVEGRMRIGGEECSLVPWLANGPRKLELSDASARYDCRIRQPLRTQMVQELRIGTSALNLYSKAGQARVSLEGMTWQGTVARADGELPLTQCRVSSESVLVKGPVREDTADKVLWRLEPQFVSQTYYDLQNGSPRPLTWPD